MLVYGSVLGCLEPVASVVACLSSRSPFLASLGLQASSRASAAFSGLEVEAAQRRLKAPQSDLQTLANALDGMVHMSKTPHPLLLSPFFLEANARASTTRTD